MNYYQKDFQTTKWIIWMCTWSDQRMACQFHGYFVLYANVSFKEKSQIKGGAYNHQHTMRSHMLVHTIPSIGIISPTLAYGCTLKCANFYVCFTLDIEFQCLKGSNVKYGFRDVGHILQKYAHNLSPTVHLHIPPCTIYYFVILHFVQVILIIHCYWHPQISSQKINMKFIRPTSSPACTHSRGVPDTEREAYLLCRGTSDKPKT